MSTQSYSIWKPTDYKMIKRLIRIENKNPQDTGSETQQPPVSSYLLSTVCVSQMWCDNIKLKEITQKCSNVQFPLSIRIKPNHLIHSLVSSKIFEQEFLTWAETLISHWLSAISSSSSLHESLLQWSGWILFERIVSFVKKTVEMTLLLYQKKLDILCIRHWIYENKFADS